MIEIVKKEEEEDEEEEDHAQNWEGTRYTPFNIREETPLVSSFKKPKVPTPPTNNGDHTWKDPTKYDNWATQVMEYLQIHGISLISQVALAYAAGYVDGTAKE